MSEGPPLRTDIWQQCIAPHLRCLDMCKLMRMSTAWFYYWISDASWAWQRGRICARFPELKQLFEDHALDSVKEVVTRSKKSNGNKKRKTAWIMPRAGIWYVFKRLLLKVNTMSGFKVMLREPALDYFAICILRTLVPGDGRDESVKPKVYHTRNAVHVMHSFSFYFGADKSHLSFSVVKGWGHLCCSYHSHLSDIEWNVRELYGAQWINGIGDLTSFMPWHNFVLQRAPLVLWNSKLKELIKEK